MSTTQYSVQDLYEGGHSLVFRGGDYITVVDGSSVRVADSRNTVTHSSGISQRGCYPHVLLYWTTVSAVPSHLPLLARSVQQERGALTAGLPRLLTAADESPTLATGAEATDEHTPRRPGQGGRSCFLYVYFFIFLKKLIYVQRCCALSH